GETRRRPHFYLCLQRSHRQVLIALRNLRHVGQVLARNSTVDCDLVKPLGRTRLSLREQLVGTVGLDPTKGLEGGRVALGSVGSKRDRPTGQGFGAEEHPT